MVDSPAHRQITLDAHQVIGLAHPLRSRLLTALRRHGPATATTLATRLASNTGTTSYHLRKLAALGLVVDDPTHGDGRDRYWRAAQDSHSYSGQAFPDDPDATAATDWLYAHYLRLHARNAEDWVESRSEWPSEWQQASTMSDFQLRLTPRELRALNAELEAVITRWRETVGVRHDAPARPGTERVTIQLHDFPVRGSDASGEPA